MDMVARAKQASRSTPMVANLSLGSSYRYGRTAGTAVCVRGFVFFTRLIHVSLLLHKKLNHSSTVNSAVSRLASLGVIVAVAAGNEGQDARCVVVD